MIATGTEIGTTQEVEAIVKRVEGSTPVEGIPDPPPIFLQVEEVKSHGIQSR